MEVDHQSTGVIGPRTEVPFSQLWKAMVEKITDPGKYLKGVKSVTHTANPDGSIYREMHLESGGSMRENVHADESTKRIEFRVVDKPLVVVNQYREGDGAIEYLVEDDKGHCLGWWKGMRDGTMEAIKGQYEKAKDL